MADAQAALVLVQGRGVIENKQGSSPPSRWGIDDTGTNLSDLPTAANLETQYWYDDNGGLRFQFDNPYYVAPPPPPDPVERIVATGGGWENSFDYYYFGTTGGLYLYGLVDKGSTARYDDSDQWDIEYNPGDGKFYDIGTSQPVQWGPDNTGTNTSDFPTSTNMPIHYWYSSGGNLKLQFNNPYYVA